MGRARSWLHALQILLIGLLAALLVGEGTVAARPRARRPIKRRPPPPPAEKAAPQPRPQPPRAAPSTGGGTNDKTALRESHIEFDERLVQGQTASGAIYLFQRASSDFQSMIQVPESFRDRTVRDLQGGERRK